MTDIDGQSIYLMTSVKELYLRQNITSPILISASFTWRNTVKPLFSIKITHVIVQYSVCTICPAFPVLSASHFFAAILDCLCPAFSACPVFPAWPDLFCLAYPSVESIKETIAKPLIPMTTLTFRGGGGGERGVTARFTIMFPSLPS